MVICLSPLSSFAADKNDSTTNTVFDLQAMKSRGIDPSVAQWFSQAPRFMPGESKVKLIVNGVSKGQVKVKFDDEGKLCADTEFEKNAGLIAPSKVDTKQNCFDLQKAWPQMEVNLDPGEGVVDIVASQQDIADSTSKNTQWQHGGHAALLNYDAQYMDSAGNDNGTNFLQLDTEGGFNIDDWIVRSNQTFSRLNDEEHIQHGAAYAQRTFDGVKKVFQAGQIPLSNSMFGAGQVLGAQFFPEAALQNPGQGAGLVEGIADTQSVVEVRQSGVLVYSTTVPAGPFKLQGLSLLNMRSDLAVTLTGNNGEKRQFTVPSTSFMSNGPMVAPGLSFGMGKLDQDGSNESPFLATIASGWLLSPRTTLNAGLLGSDVYQAGAVSLVNRPFRATDVSLQTTAAQDSKHSSSGVLITAGVNHQLTEQIGLTLGISQQTPGYFELNDAIQDEKQNTQDRTRSQYSAGVGWGIKTLGSFSLSVAQSHTFSGNNNTYLRGGWTRQFGRAYIGVSVEHDTGNNQTDNSPENRMYLTMSIPLGKANISSYLNSAQGGSKAGVRYSDSSSQDRNWSISSDRDYRSNRNSYMGTMNMVTPFSQLNGSISQDSDHYTSWSTRASGAVVVHNHGLTLAPYKVTDTFGLAKVGDEGGVRLNTPAGPTWTDSQGYAVLPSLNRYGTSVIQVDPRSLGKNVDIMNAWQETAAARGSINYIDFDIVHTRRVLVSVVDKNNIPAPHGASVFDVNGEFVTVVGENGQVFIPDGKPDMTLEIQASGKTIGLFKLNIPEKAEPNSLFETDRAVYS